LGVLQLTVHIRGQMYVLCRLAENDIIIRHVTDKSADGSAGQLRSMNEEDGEANHNPWLAQFCQN